MHFGNLTVTSREAKPALAAELQVPNTSKKPALFKKFLASKSSFVPFCNATKLLLISLQLPVGRRGRQRHWAAPAASSTRCLSVLLTQGRNLETATHGACGISRAWQTAGTHTHHCPLAPAVCSEGIWRLRLSEIPLFVQQMLNVVSLIKKKKKNLCKISLPHI